MTHSYVNIHAGDALGQMSSLSLLLTGEKCRDGCEKGDC